MQCECSALVSVVRLPNLFHGRLVKWQAHYFFLLEIGNITLDIRNDWALKWGRLFFFFFLRYSMAINEYYFEEPDPQAKEAISKQKNDFRHRSTAFFNICMHMLTVLDCFTFNIIYVRIVAEVIYHMLDSCNAKAHILQKIWRKIWKQSLEQTAPHTVHVWLNLRYVKHASNGNKVNRQQEGIVYIKKQISSIGLKRKRKKILKKIGLQAYSVHWLQCRFFDLTLCLWLWRSKKVN